MKTIYVTMNDLYGSANFSVDAQDTTLPAIEDAIRTKYKYWSDALSKVGAGTIQVHHDGHLIASGSIVWWFAGGYSIHLDVPKQEHHVRRLVHPTDYPMTERTSPACCGFV